MRGLPFIRQIKLLRLPALLVLVFAMLATPVLAAVGDLHDVGHSEMADAGAHGVDDHDSDDEHSEGDLLHAFMHAAHCCSHLAAVFESVSLAGVHDLVPATQLPEIFAPPPAPRTSVFRPPIAI
jgi:hypothetical protein